MELLTAIQYVGSGLTLVAFIVSAATLAYQQRLKAREKQILAVPETDRLKAAQDAAEYIHIDITTIPGEQRAQIVLEQLRLKAQKQWQVFLGFVLFAGLIGAATLAAMILLPKPDPPVSPPAVSARPENGWAWVGYLDQADSRVWATGPFFDIESYSGSANRPYPVREGDVIRPRKDLPQVIVGFASTGQDNVLEPPPRVTSTINPKRDYTGQMYEAAKTYLVNDVQVWNIPEKDPVVWLRLTPGEPDRTRAELPKPRATTVVAYQVCTGEYERACGPHNAYLYCYQDVKAWATKQCQSLAGEVAAVSRVSTRGGNKCGYDDYTVLCSVPQ